MGAAAKGGVEALLRPETARTLDAANDNEDSDQRSRRLEAKLDYGWPVFAGRFTAAPEIGFRLSESDREYIHGWRLAEAKRSGLAFGLDVEAARREPMTDDAAPEHRLGFGLGWRRDDSTFEFRLEGSRLQPVNDNRAAEHRIGLSLSARW